MYEFSETRKVLEDFFNEPTIDPILNDSDSVSIVRRVWCDFIYLICHIFPTFSFQECDKSSDNAYIGQRLAHLSSNQYSTNDSPKQRSGYYDMELYLDSNSSGDAASKDSPAVNRQKATNATLSPDSIEYDSNSGDLESLPNDINCQVEQSSVFNVMPNLEDGLSSGHASDTDVVASNPINCDVYPDRSKTEDIHDGDKINELNEEITENISVESTLRDIHSTLQRTKILLDISNQRSTTKNDNSDNPNVWVRRYVSSVNIRNSQTNLCGDFICRDSINTPDSINSDQNLSKACPDDEEADTDLETDRLLGQQRLDNIGNLKVVRYFCPIYRKVSSLFF